MDKFQAIHTFWNGFGLPAYDENTVPEEATLPYITYEASIADFDEKMLVNASLWYQSTSWESISQKTEEISTEIGGGSGVTYDNGRLWITKGTPFALRMSEPDNPLIRRIVLQVSVEFQ